MASIWGPFEFSEDKDEGMSRRKGSDHNTPLVWLRAKGYFVQENMTQYIEKAIQW